MGAVAKMCLLLQALANISSCESSLWLAGMQNLHVAVQNDARDENPHPTVFKLAGVSRENGTEWVFEKKERTAGDEGIQQSWGGLSTS